MSWREQQVGVGVTRCPLDQDMLADKARDAADRAWEERIAVTRRMFADAPGLEHTYGPQH